MKVMETVNVVIVESSKFSFNKFGEEIPKEILPSEPKEVQETVGQELASPSNLDTPSVVDQLTYLLHLILNPMRRNDLPLGSN